MRQLWADFVAGHKYLCLILGLVLIVLRLDWVLLHVRSVMLNRVLTRVPFCAYSHALGVLACGI